MESRIRIILKNVIDIAEVLGLKDSGPLKALNIYQYRRTSFLYILPCMLLDLYTLQMVQFLSKKEQEPERYVIMVTT